MELLKEAIRREGKVLPGDILDVSSFLNMQVDCKLMEEIGKEFAEYYKDYDFDAFITVEASGIAPSVFAALYANKPLVIIKKEQRVKENTAFIQQPCYSYTKKNDYYLTVQKQFIEGRKLILIDDFLAQGSVVENVGKLLEKGNAEYVATGILVSKNYQEGFGAITNSGHDLHSLAQIVALNEENAKVVFLGE